jgi:hypothetical protein
MVEVQEERRARLRAVLDESRCAGIELGVNVASHLVAELLGLAKLLALASFHDRGARIAVGSIPGIVKPQAFVIGVRDAIPLVEAVIGGPAALALADMPLAQAHRRVTRLGEQVPQRAFPGHQARALPTGHHHRVVPRPDRIATRQQRRTGRGALRLRGVIEQPKAGLSELVDTARISATQHTPAVTAQLAIPEVVDVKEHDVRLIRHFNTSRGLTDWRPMEEFSSRPLRKTGMSWWSVGR